MMSEAVVFAGMGRYATRCKYRKKTTECLLREKEDNVRRPALRVESRESQRGKDGK